MAKENVFLPAQFEAQTVDVTLREIEEMENEARAEHGGFIYVLSAVHHPADEEESGTATFEIFAAITAEE